MSFKEIRIYTNPDGQMKWLDYYVSKFTTPSCCIKIYPHTEFKEPEFLESAHVILATDDDPHFPMEFMKLPDAHKKVISYDHNIALRQPNVSKHITTRPYFNDERKNTPFMYPIYPIISLEDKRHSLASESTINIAVVGGSWNTNHFWRYLFPNNNMNDIKIFFIHRNQPGIWGRMDRYVKSICKNTEIYNDCDTFQLLELLKRSHYVAFLTDIDQFAFHSCSGSVGLAFNTGCTLLLTKKYNSEYRFRNVVYFDDCPKLVSELNEDIFKERDELIHVGCEALLKTKDA